MRRLIEARIPLDGASDHGVSEAVYFRDPDGNGIEIYRDRPREEWPRDGEGNIAMVTRPLDVAEAVWRAATDPASPPRMAAGADAIALAGSR